MTMGKVAKGVGRWLVRQSLRAPLAALLIALFLDVGPGGELRVSPFPLALRALDPFVWTCAIQSTIFAAAVALAALAVGGTLGGLIGGRAFWGRPLLATLVIAPLAAAPASLAIGLKGLSTWGVDLVSDSEGSLAPGSPGAFSLGLAWFWTTLPAATAWVALATARAYAALRPSWSDVARTSGAGPFMAWSKLTRPLVRTAALRASAVVFAVALVEPSAPLVLGLRRTLGFQIVRQLSQPQPFPALAIWTAIALVLAWLGSGALWAWGGLDRLERDGIEPSNERRTDSHARAALATLLLLGWALIAWAPAAGLAHLAIAADPGASRTHASLAAQLWIRLIDPVMISTFVNSAILGAGAAVLILGLAAVTGRTLVPRLGADDRGPLFTPPLAVGVGVLALGWLLARLGPAALEAGSPAWIARAIGAMGRGLDPDVRPEPALILGVAWGLSMLFGGRSRSDQAPAHVVAATQAAMAAGFSRRRSARLAAPSAWGRRLALVFAMTTLCATNVAPALLFAPWSDTRPIGPALLALATGPDADLAAAALLAILLTGISALGLAAARFAFTRRGPA